MAQTISRKRPLSDKSAFCDSCQITFTRRESWYHHIRKTHPDQVQNIPYKKHRVCGVCAGSFRLISELYSHLENEHNVQLKFTSHTFYSEDDFLDWKTKTEIESKAFFIKYCIKSKEEGFKCLYYSCHRSGFQNLKTDRQRRVKGSGSVKINSTCPATIKVSSQTVEGITEMNVTYQSVHVGHELEVSKLHLSKKDKLNLASSLNLGVPMKKIIDEVREKCSPNERIGLTSQQDLLNIIRCYKIDKKAVLPQDDATSVDLLVRNVINDNKMDIPILLYKPLGDITQNYDSVVKKEDILLGFMSKAQEMLLELNGRNCVMIDCLDGTFQYGFTVTTLLVQDKNNEEVLPVATYFSSRISTETLVPFFSEIKLRLPDFKTEVLMTEDNKVFIDSWKMVFEDEARHLLCRQKVYKNWDFSLQSKAKNNKNRKDIRATLKTLLTEVDVEAFEHQLQRLIQTYEETEPDFIRYFQTHYEKRPEKWSYCYRVGLNINPNIKLEKWHGQFMLEKSGQPIMKNMDKTILVVLNTVAKKLLSKIISLEKEKIPKRINLTQQRHVESLKMSENYSFLESEDKFVVMETEGSSVFTYEVEKKNNVCHCPIRCYECKICIHSFTCSCLDFSINFLICKHIHYIYLKSNNHSYHEVVFRPEFQQINASEYEQINISEYEQINIIDLNQTIVSEFDQADVSNLNQTIATDFNHTIATDLNQTIATDFNQTIATDFNQTIVSQLDQTCLSELEQNTIIVESNECNMNIKLETNAFASLSSQEHVAELQKTKDNILSLWKNIEKRIQTVDSQNVLDYVTENLNVINTCLDISEATTSNVTLFEIEPSDIATTPKINTVLTPKIIVIKNNI